MAEELGISSESLRRWIRQHEIDEGEREGLLTDEREELSKLRRENRILLKQEKEVVANSGGLLCQGGRDSVNLFGFIDAERAYLPVALLCRMLGVSRSGYSTPGDPRDPSKRSRQDAALTAKIHESHRRSRQTYGSARVHAELRALGVRCGRKRVERLMPKLDCEAACAAEGEGPLAEARGRRPRTS